MKGPREPSHFIAAIAMWRTERKGEGKEKENKVKREKSWGNGSKRWEGGPVRRLLGGRLSRKFRNTRHVASRTSDICAKDMLEVSATNQKLGRQSMEIGDGTEVG